MLLDVEARIGELSLAEPQEKYVGIPKDQRGVKKQPDKHERMGLRKGQMRTAQTIARHPEAVAMLREPPPSLHSRWDEYLSRRAEYMVELRKR